MRFEFTEKQKRFREDIREFLKKELPSSLTKEMEIRPEEGGFSKEFSRKLGQKGWIGLTWPKEYGGQQLGYIERLIYNEEMTYNHAPIYYHHLAERQMGPSIIQFGTEEQKRYYLPRIARGEAGFCIGYSEPGAGSDLASLKTRAVADGDDYIISGQKIYTSGAHINDYIWLATRTDPDAPKHKGISVFIVGLKSPGVEVRPLWTMAGGQFNEVFFDNVRVPRANMVGQENQGWYVVAANLDFERAGIERVVEYLLIFEQLVQYVKEAPSPNGPLAKDPTVRNRLAKLAIEFQVGRMLAYRVAWMLSEGDIPNRESAQSKVFGSELAQRVCRAGMQILGLYGQLTAESQWGPLQGKIQQGYLSSVSDTIRAGTSEIMRNIIATRGLGLPR